MGGYLSMLVMMVLTSTMHQLLHMWLKLIFYVLSENIFFVSMYLEKQLELFSGFRYLKWKDYNHLQ